MNIYIIKRTDAIGWDEYEGFVVVAKNEQEAREIASKEAADEGEDIWFNHAYTRCEVVDTLVGPRVVLSSFNAG